MVTMQSYPQQTVLVVDDVEANVKLLSRLLQRLNVQTLCAYNGWDALAILEKHPVDLILLDISMPDMDGYTVLRHIRETNDMQMLPVILISAFDTDDHVIEGLNLGANDYITKPFSNKIVHQRVQIQLQLQHLTCERQQALAAAQEADALKTQLLRIASHDLKNPLNNLLMLFEMFDEHEPIPAEFVEMADHTTRKMLNIVTDFLDSGVLEIGSFQVKMVPVDIGQLVNDVVETFGHAAAKKRVSIQVELEPGYVQADERRLEQVVTNMISNAIKYTYPDTMVHVVGTRDGDGYRLDVRDQGDGVPPAELHRLFQPFGKLSTRPTAGEDSNGLGLYIVKQMAEVQGGTVGLDGTYPEGADFWLWLPRA